MSRKTKYIFTLKNNYNIKIFCALSFVFIIMACVPLKPVPKESYINKNIGNTDQSNSNSNVDNSRNDNEQVSEFLKVEDLSGQDQDTSSVIVDENESQNNFDTSVTNDITNEGYAEQHSTSASSNSYDSSNYDDTMLSDVSNKMIVQNLRDEAVKDVKEHFDINVSNQSVQSEPKGVFTVRNTNFITIGEKGDIWLWSANLKNKSFVENLGTCVDKVDFDHNTLLLFWSCGAKLYTKELLNENSLRIIDRIKTRASAFSVYKNASEILVGGADGKLYRWSSPLDINIKDFDNFERYTAHSTVVSAVAFHPAGRVFFSGDWQGKFKAWLSYKEDEFGGAYDENLFGGRFFEDGSTVKDSGRSGGSIEKIIVSPQGNFIILGFQDSMIELWKLRSFKKVLEFKANDLRLIDVDFVNEDEFTTLTKDNVIRYWKYSEELDDLGEHVYKEKLLAERVLENPAMVYVTNNHDILYANKSGSLKMINLKEK